MAHLLAALIGAAFAAALIALGIRRPASAERMIYAVGLVAAALAYVVFTALGAPALLPRESLGVALFTAAAWIGATRVPLLLAIGWAAHVAWDVALHPPGAADGVPWWYPSLCIGFDLVLAARLVRMSTR